MNAARKILLLSGILLHTSVVITAAAPMIVLVSAEDEYKSATTLPLFAKSLETNYGARCVYHEKKATNDIPGTEALERADLLILFGRRTILPEEQLNRFKKYFDSGKPVIGLRTASHAFQNWLVFDKLVLGGNYQNHHGKSLSPVIAIEPSAKNHPLLHNVPARFTTEGSLYKNTPLQTNTTVLLTGTIPDKPTEPVAWIHDYKGARVFYTSLGHPDDFEQPAFRQLLVNAIFWALKQP